MTSHTDLRDALQAILDGFIARGIVGAGLTVIAPDNERIVLCAGLADRAGNIPVRPDHLFKIGSCTKPFVAATLLSSRAGDYRVRIFTPSLELPFAGHPTLGTCHAWLAAGGTPRQDGAIVQQCGAGPVRVRRTADGLAFAAPPLLRSGPVERGAGAAPRRGARHRPRRHRGRRVGRQRAGLGGRAARQRRGGAGAAAGHHRPGPGRGRPVPAGLAAGVRGAGVHPQWTAARTRTR